MTINIGLLGFGNVGKSVLDILVKNKNILSHRTGTELNITKVLVRDLSKKRDVDTHGISFTDNPDNILNDANIHIVVEVMGGEYPAYDFIKKALSQKKYVVTANKEVMSKHKREFFQLAYDNQVDIYYEAAVGGGIPLIRTLKVGLAANKIESLYGIVNGTTNYILTKIEEEHQDFDVVLKKAQELGFAEADPTMDVAGLDSAHKLVILAAVAFKVDIQLDDLFHEGIQAITLKDIQYANELGYTIKLLSIGKLLEDGKMMFKTHPTMIPLNHPLASVKNEVNAVYVTGNAVGESLLSGKGAGGSPTGSAVVSDIIDITFDRQLSRPSKRNLEDKFQDVSLCPISETSTQFFFRVSAPDETGILEKITGVLGRHDVSISKVLQKDIQNNAAEIVFVTHSVLEKKMMAALEELTSHNIVNEVLALIRVGLDES